MAVARRRRDIEPLLWAAVGEMTEELAAHPSTRRVVGETQSSHMTVTGSLLEQSSMMLELFTVTDSLWVLQFAILSV